MDIVQIRRQRLRNLIDTEYSGSQAAFVEKTGINQGELSGLLRKKSFGEKKARALEVAAGLETMYFDKIEGAEGTRVIPQQDNRIPAPTLTQEEERLLALIKDMSPEVRNALLKIASAIPVEQKSARVLKNVRPIRAKVIRPKKQRDIKRRGENDG